MTAGRGGAGTTRHEIRGGKNWLAIFICAQLNKREAAALLCILSQGGRGGGAGKVESMEPGWDGKWYYRAGGIYCLVQRGCGRVGEQRGSQDTGTWEKRDVWKVRRGKDRRDTKETVEEEKDGGTGADWDKNKRDTVREWGEVRNALKSLVQGQRDIHWE